MDRRSFLTGAATLGALSFVPTAGGVMDLDGLAVSYNADRDQYDTVLYLYGRLSADGDLVRNSTQNPELFLEWFDREVAQLRRDWAQNLADGQATNWEDTGRWRQVRMAKGHPASVAQLPPLWNGSRREMEPLG